MKPKSLSVALREGSRDTALMAGFVLVLYVLNQIRHGDEIVVPTGRMMTLCLVVLVLTWIAMVIACRLGASTLTSFLHQSGKGRVPDTLAVFIITSFVASIALLFMGLVK